MSNFSYGFWWSYGVGTWRQTSDGSEVMPGELQVFESRKARDEWVDADVFDGNYHRSAVGAKTARDIMVDELFNFYPGCKFTLDWDNPSAAKRYAPTDEIVATWRKYHYFEVA